MLAPKKSLMCKYNKTCVSRASQAALAVKTLPADAGDGKDTGSIAGGSPWKTARQPTPVFLPREGPGGLSPWDCKESDTTEVT